MPESFPVPEEGTQVMNPKRVSEIIHEKRSLRARLRPLKRGTDTTDWRIVGFDSEYNVGEQRLISYQLWRSERSFELIGGPQPLSLSAIAEHAYELCCRSDGDQPKRICIVSYYNTAELSQLAKPFWKEEGVSFYKVHPSGLYHIEGRRDEYSFLFYDLWHFFASYDGSSLHRVAEDFGFRKLEYDVTDLHDGNLDDPRFIEYALNDAKLCVQIFERLNETYQEVNRISILERPTPANAAQASFKLNYLRKEVKAPNIHVRHLALRSNWAGRVECGFVGSLGGIHEYDADSLYPRSVLLLPNLPSHNDWHLGIPPSFEGVEGFVEVDFEFPQDEEWPCLPVLRESRLVFPLSGKTACTIGEFRAALSRGVRIKRIDACAWYAEGEHDEFHRFIDDNIALKETSESNKAIRAVAKLNMNSAIGKFIENKGGMDYEAAKEFIDQQQIPEELVPYVYANLLRPLHIDFNKPVRLGSSFYPEWHTLILGKAREVMAYSVYNARAYPKILMISTDSLHIPGETIGETAVRFNHKHGPVDFTAIRGRLHLSKDEQGRIVKVAHHGMPCSSETAATVIVSAITTGRRSIEMERKGRTTLRDSVLLHVPFGTTKLDPDYRVSLQPDSKRRIDDQGWTHPLKIA